MKLPALLIISLGLFILVASCSKSDPKPAPAVTPVPPKDSTITKTDTAYDVYIVGYMGNNVGYWKNGQFATLGTSATFAFAADMAFSGKDIYVAGQMGDSSGYWKNNAFNLIAIADTLTPISIAVSGSDVYSFLQRYPGVWNGYLYKNNAVNMPIPTVNEPSFTVMSVNGSNLYIPGTIRSGNESAVYWKNGIAVSLPTSLKRSY